MLYSAIKQSIVLRSIWFAVTIVLLWNFMGKLGQETKWLMCAVHVGIGRWGTDGFSKASNFPEVSSLKIQEVSQEHLKWPGTENSVRWIWGCRMRLWQVSEELLAPPPIFLFLLLTLSPASSPFVLLVELFAQYHRKTGWWFDSDGKKMGKKKSEKVSAVVGLCFQMDLISSVIYHVAAHSWTMRLVQVESAATEIPLTLEMIPQAMLPRHKRCCHHRA